MAYIGPDGQEYLGYQDYLDARLTGESVTGTLSGGQVIEAKVTPPPLAENKNTQPAGADTPNAQSTLQDNSAELVEARGLLNQSPVTNPQDFSVQSDGSLVPKRRVGGFRQVDASQSYTDRHLRLQFSRQDTLDYGFTFELIRLNNDEPRLFTTLFINPEELTQSEPPRLTVTQTKDGVYVDHFGEGIKQINIRGITGYHLRDMGGDNLVSGHQHFLDLRALVRDWHVAFKDDPENTEMRFYNWTDEEYYEVAITQFQLTRSVQRPLLYQYSIQMLVIQDITEKVNQARDNDDDISEYLTYPEKRAPLIQDKIDLALKEVDDKIKKKVDLTRFSRGTQEWAPAISKGKTYFDSPTRVFRPIEDLISDVNQFSKNIKMYVSGATSFITKPFELVRDMTVSVSDVISSMVSVANIPHELVRSFNDMICAIKALPESLFKGFTNPNLFEGASNCGSTLGIPEASVAAYNNSFSATAQIPLDREVFQEFLVPRSKLLIKEEPTEINGIFLSSDASRTGLNYLDTWTGKEVTLTSVPNSPIIVDYKVKQLTTVDMIKLKSAKTQVISEMDTLEKIALKAYDDASRWKEISLFNGLEYPFIVDYEFVKEIKAKGSVRFYRSSSYFADIVIPADTRVFVPSYRGTRQINFRTTESKTMDISKSYIDVLIEAEQPGYIGNVASGLIIAMLPAITGISSLTNLTTTSGGKIWKVLKPGDIIFIPSTETDTASLVYKAELTYEQLFGLDIYLNKLGEVDPVGGSLSDTTVVSGTKNLIQALKNRIATVAGTYVYHKEYGSHIPFYIGKKNIPQWINLVKADVKQVCMRDPRVSQLKAFKLFAAGDTISIAFDAIPISSNSSLRVNLIV